MKVRMINISVAITWIKADFGGRSHPPFIGMKPVIRFQRYINEWILGVWDVEVMYLEFDETTWSGFANLQFSPSAPNNMEGLKKSELIELLDGYRVIAVGKIIEIL